MPSVMKLFASLFAMIALALANPASAQGGVPDIVGEWSGPLAIPIGDLTIVLHVERNPDGTLKAALEDFDRMPGMTVPADSISMGDGKLLFKVGTINASFVGDWDEASQQWMGTFTQGQEFPLRLSRGGPPAKPLVVGLDGLWKATVQVNNATLRQGLVIRTVEGSTYAVYDSPDQMASGIPVTDLAKNGQDVSFALMRGVSQFKGTLSEDGNQLTGTLSARNQQIPVTFTRSELEAAQAGAQPPPRPQTPVEPFPYRTEEVVFDNPSFPEVHLAGTLSLPEGPGPYPAAIMITGSGGQDRDETLMGHKPFAVIADHLARNGIAVLRFDDRGVGKSTGTYATATSADLATDANAAFAYLRARIDIRNDAIGFIGHSEGGMIGPIAMAENPDVAYFVGLAAPGTDLDKLLLSQRRLLTTQMGLSQADIDKQEPILASMFQAFVGADTPEAGQEAALAVLTPQAKVTLGLPADSDGNMVVRQFSGPWFYYFLKYDPVPNLAAIHVPALFLNGSLDLQVPAAENLPAIREATRGNPDVTIVELPGLNHLFQTATTGSVGEYRDIEETFSPTALDMMTNWISQRFVRK